MPGNVRKIETVVGDRVAVGDTLIVRESMKIEIVVLVPAAGRIAEIVGQAGRPGAEWPMTSVDRDGEER